MAAAGHFVSELNQQELTAADARTALEFMDDLDALNMVHATHYTRASDYVRQQIALIKTLEDKGAKVILHDPYVQVWDLGPHEVERDLHNAAIGSDCLALVTKHRDYRDIDFAKIGDLMRTRTLVDGRNLYEEKEVTAHGFEYRAIGKSGPKR